MELVAARVEERDPDGPEQGAPGDIPQSPPPGSGEQRIAGDVTELSEDDHPPRVVAGRRLCGEPEDHAHQGDRHQESEECAVAWIQRRAARPGKRVVVISVTSKSRYAVVALAELARATDSPMPIGQVAERRGIPVQFLEQLFSTLRRAGILTSHRGAKGGYTLARPADQINVLEVVQALDGVVGQEGKEAGGIWEEGVEALRATFRDTTIADISRREAEEAGAGMYHI